IVADIELIITAADVNEGEDITVKAKLTTPADTAMTITLSNGEIIRIAAGETEGEAIFANPNTEDVYVDTEDLTYNVTVSGGFDVSVDLIKPDSVTVKVNDTIDVTTVSLL